MKTIKFIFVKVLLLEIGGLSAQVNWQTSTQNYNGNEYTIENSKYICAVTNKKYAFKGVTNYIEFDGERLEDLEKRREGLMGSIYKVANEVFNTYKQISIAVQKVGSANS